MNTNMRRKVVSGFVWIYTMGPSPQNFSSRRHLTKENGQGRLRLFLPLARSQSVQPGPTAEMVDDHWEYQRQSPTPTMSTLNANSQPSDFAASGWVGLPSRRRWMLQSEKLIPRAPRMA